ncbi:short-chain fatty acid transporter [Lentibacillus sp. L22]|uniref:short-chain fatty acid transporter n=1 Tax=Lentibacillus sp. L22 TaxID=3163028 RepID=UPI003466F84F
MKTMTNFFDRFVQRYLPDAFLFAITLTIVVFLIGMFVMGNTPVQMIDYWGNGFWDLLEFAMQMSLIVVTGNVLANTPVVKRLLEKPSALAKSPAQAVILVTITAIVASLINYGFGLVGGALFALQVAKRVPSADYRLLIASAYSGFLLWHGGLSGAIPLWVATPGHFLEDTIGTIPVTETLFSGSNLFIILILLITLPFLNRMLLKTQEGKIQNQIDWKDTGFKEEFEEPELQAQTPSERLENSRIVSLIIGIFGLTYIIYHFSANGFDLNIDIVNLIMLFLGILLHRTPRRFLNSVNHAVRDAGGIIIQFPFYAGIMGMMVDSGLSESMSLWFVSISNEFTYPLFVFLSAGLVNFFVPSGGGQWAVQGPMLVSASIDIGVDPTKTAMAVAWGSAWTNMIQPFWALPLLSVAGLKVKDIMGFCFIILVYSFFPIAIGLLFF